MPTAMPADSSVCPQCGNGLRCGVASGEASCWCFDMPRVVPVPQADATTKQSCLCPECLQKLIDKNALPDHEN